MSSTPHDYGFCQTNDQPLISLIPVAAESDLAAINLTAGQMAWLTANDFNYKSGQYCAVPHQDGHIDCVLFVADR